MDSVAIHIDGLIYGKQAHGGISRVFTNLINAFVARSDVDVSLYLADGVDQPTDMQKLKTFRIPGDIRIRPARLFKGIAERLSRTRRQRFWSKRTSGVFHSSYYSAPDGVPVPQVLSMQDTIFEDYPELFSTPSQLQHLADKRKAVERSAALVFSSNFARERTLALYSLGSRPTLVSPYAVDPRFSAVPEQAEIARFRDAHGVGRPFLLHVGARYLHKNVWRLIEAYSHWQGRKDFALVLAGGGPLAGEERALIESHGAAGDIVVIPKLSDADLVLAYHAGSALVFPSLSEGFGFPVLEALACGCPVASSNAASLPEVGQEFPVYFDPSSTDSIAAGLDALVLRLGDVRHWHAARVAANSRSWQDVAGEYVAFYRSL